MYILTLDNDNDSFKEADYLGNNASFTCPSCGNVFIVSAFFSPPSNNRKYGEQECNCTQSKAYIQDGKKSGGKAWIESKVEIKYSVKDKDEQES